VIDDGTELLAIYTPQPASIPWKERNGFLALANMIKPENGATETENKPRRCYFQPVEAVAGQKPQRHSEAKSCFVFLR